MIDGLKSLTYLSIPQRAIRALIINLFKAKILFGSQLIAPAGADFVLRLKSDEFGQALPRASKQKALEITKDEKQENIEQLANKLHKPFRRPYQLRKIHFRSKDNIWNADLVIMPTENNYKYILTVLDGYTRYAWVIPLKHKDGLSVSNAFKEIMKKSNRKPNKLWLDQGKEFYNEHMYKLFKFKKEDICISR